MADNSALRNYIEEVTLALEQTGLPRTSGRILAWLLVCKPAEQNMNDIMDALQLSKSSVSAATVSLIQFRLIERVSLPGRRRDYYRVQADFWNTLMVAQTEEIRHLREVAEKGLQVIANTDTTHTQRLEEMYDFSLFWEQEMPHLLRRWEEKRSRLQR